jgi:hypothetical protein
VLGATAYKEERAAHMKRRNFLLSAISLACTGKVDDLLPPASISQTNSTVLLFDELVSAPLAIQSITNSLIYSMTAEELHFLEAHELLHLKFQERYSALYTPKSPILRTVAEDLNLPVVNFQYPETDPEDFVGKITAKGTVDMA